MSDIIPTIRTILSEHSGIEADAASLDQDLDLYSAGMTSRTTISIMLALEDAFDIEFPDSMLRRDAFESISAIADVIENIR